MNALVGTTKRSPRTGIIRLLAQLLGYYQTEAAGTAPAYAGNAETAQAAKAKPITHRFRLFKCQGLEPNHFIYAEVWDTSKEPAPESGLPNGIEIKTIEGSSLSAVEEDAHRYCQSLGSVQIADWRDIGSI